MGAGPTGLTLACELRRFGVGCRIIDRRAVHVDRSRAADVQSRTLEVFDALGVLPRVLAEGRKLIAMSIYDSPRVLARLQLTAKEAYYPLTVALPQARTEQILEERLEELGGTVERGVRLDALTGDHDGVEVEIATSDGKTERSRVDWVVGCDGVGSVVRHHAGIAFDVKDRPQSFSTADASIDWHLPADEISLFISSDGFLMIIPLPGDHRVRVIAQSYAPERRIEDLEGLTALASRHAGAEVTLRSPGFVSTYHVQRRLASEFQRGRVLLAGDAAHSFDPVGGHGMNQGIQDAHNLGWKLALVILGQSPNALVATYASERRGAAKSFIREIDFEARLRLSQMSASTEDYEKLMDFAVGASPLRRSVLDSALLQQQMYDTGTFVQEHVASGFDVGGGLSAGSAVPAVPHDDDPGLAGLRRAVRLSVLIFTGSSGRVAPSILASAAELQRLFGELATICVVSPDPDAGGWSGESLHDGNGALHLRFGAPLPCAYVLRPDGYVAYRCCPFAPNPLKSFLRTLLTGSYTD